MEMERYRVYYIYRTRTTMYSKVKRERSEYEKGRGDISQPIRAGILNL